MSLPLGAAVAITAAMEGLILATVFGLLLIIIVYTCTKRKNRVDSIARNGKLITQCHNVIKNCFSPDQSTALNVLLIQHMERKQYECSNVILYPYT